MKDSYLLFNDLNLSFYHIRIFLCGEIIFADIIFYSLASLVILILIWQPRWLKPVWLCWLEDNYGEMLDEMFEEVRQMGVKKWEKETRTQADLERWADSVAKEHGWRRLRKGNGQVK